MAAANIQALAEAASGLVGSTVLARQKDAMLNRDFKPGFRIDLRHNHMDIVTGAARADTCTSAAQGRQGARRAPCRNAVTHVCRVSKRPDRPSADLAVRR
ncbi:hypothetical protein [Streptomyces hokutonensis]|uniref:hypothetical protein n=1 Tax=Streptomyces hokutonensis TaxID=1306990 RepID=UPI003817F636